KLWASWMDTSSQYRLWLLGDLVKTYCALPGTTASDQAKFGVAYWGVLLSTTLSAAVPMYGATRLVNPKAPMTVGAPPTNSRKFALLQSGLRSIPGVAGWLYGGSGMTNWSPGAVPVPK